MLFLYLEIEMLLRFYIYGKYPFSTKLHVLQMPVAKQHADLFLQSNILFKTPSLMN